MLMLDVYVLRGVSEFDGTRRKVGTYEVFLCDAVVGARTSRLRCLQDFLEGHLRIGFMLTLSLHGDPRS